MIIIEPSLENLLRLILEHPNLIGDICDFLNDKYIDKNIDEEWPKVDVKARIKYHEEQIKILKGGKYSWNEHGNGVKQWP